MMKKVVSLVAISVVVAVLLSISGCAQVPAGYMGVQTKWSKVDKIVGEGLHWYEPVSRTIIPVNCQMQKEEHRCEAASNDLQTVTTVVALNYYIDPTKVENFYTQYGYTHITIDGVATWTYVLKLIVPRIEEVVKKVTAEYKAPELVTHRGKVKNKIEEELRISLLPFGIVVDVGGVSLTDFSFSEAYDAAIEEKQVAEQKRDKARYMLEQAEIDADTEIARASGQAEAAAMMTRSLSPLVLQEAWIAKWDGKLPTIVSDDAVVYMPPVAKPTAQ